MIDPGIATRKMSVTPPDTVTKNAEPTKVKPTRSLRVAVSWPVDQEARTASHSATRPISGTCGHRGTVGPGIVAMTTTAVTSKLALTKTKATAGMAMPGPGKPVMTRRAKKPRLAGSPSIMSRDMAPPADMASEAADRMPGGLHTAIGMIDTGKVHRRGTAKEAARPGAKTMAARAGPIAPKVLLMAATETGRPNPKAASGAKGQKATSGLTSASRRT
jgi:hypothetical protein